MFWASVVAGSAAIGLAMLHRSEDSVGILPYSSRYLLFLAALISFAVALPVVIGSEARTQRLRGLLRPSSYLPLVVLLIGQLALLDGVGLLLLRDADAQKTTLRLLAIALWNATFLLLFGSSFSRRRLREAAVFATAFWFAMAALEVVGRELLLRPELPGSLADFRTVWGTDFERIAETRRGCRILGVADSFGWALGRENYHHQVETLLRGQGFAVAVANLSIPGIGLEEEATIVERFGPAVDPAVVVHGLYVGNDFGFRDRSPWMLGRLRVYPEDSLYTPPHDWIVWQAIRQSLVLLRIAASNLVSLGIGEPPGVMSDREFLVSIGNERFAFDRQSKGVDVRRVARAIERTRQAAGRLDAKYLLLVHPSRLQLDPKLQAEVGWQGDQFDPVLPQRRVREICGSNDIRCIDLLPDFVVADPSTPLYRTRDTHYTAEGNRIAARRLATALVEIGWLDSCLDLPPPDETVRNPSPPW